MEFVSEDWLMSVTCQWSELDLRCVVTRVQIAQALANAHFVCRTWSFIVPCCCRNPGYPRPPWCQNTREPLINSCTTTMTYHDSFERYRSGCIVTLYSPIKNRLFLSWIPLAWVQLGSIVRHGVPCVIRMTRIFSNTFWWSDPKIAAAWMDLSSQLEPIIAIFPSKPCLSLDVWGHGWQWFWNVSDFMRGAQPSWPRLIQWVQQQEQQQQETTPKSQSTPAACDRIPTSVASNKQFTHSLVIRHKVESG